MGQKKLEQDLRDAGVRKKRARKVAKAADEGRGGNRAARELVEKHTAALRESISAVVSHAKPPSSKPTKKASTKKSSAKKTSAKKSIAKKRPPRKSTAKKRPAKRISSKRSSAPRTSSKSARTRTASK